MADKKHDKPKSENASFTDSDELFDTLFRKELDALSGDGNKKSTPKKNGRTSGVKRPEPTSKVKAASRKNATSQNAAGKKKILKHFPVSQGKVDTPKRVAPKKRTMLRKAVKESAAPQVKDDKQEEIILEDVIKIGETKGAEMEFGGKLAQNSDKLKIALLCLVLAVAVVFIINSLGLVDFGRLLGLSEPTEKGNMKAPVANGPPAKKPPPVAAKSPQEMTTPSAPERTTSQMRRRIVQKPPETTTPFSKPGVTERPSKRVLATRPPVNTQRPLKRDTPTQEPVVTQEPTTTTTSTPKAVVAKPPPQPSPSMQEPVIATRGPEPAISAQNPNVPDQPAESATIAQERPVTETPVQPLDSTKEPTVVKDLPQTSAQRIQPSVLKATSGSAEPTRKEAALGKQEIPPEDSDLSYPYSIYLGSFKTHQRAEKAISGYRKKGLSPYWVKIDLGDKGVWFRLYSGYFQKREQANEFIEDKKIEGAESRHTKYANLIGTFASQKNLDADKLRLSKLGYCPYVIPGPNGESLLYLGAFYQKARAQRQHAELTSKGIHSQIVER